MRVGVGAVEHGWELWVRVGVGGKARIGVFVV